MPLCYVLKMASTVLTVESSDNSDSSDDLTSTDDPPVEMYVLEWWKDNAEDLPNWSCAAKKVILTQPSSGGAERVSSTFELIV